MFPLLFQVSMELSPWVFQPSLYISVKRTQMRTCMDKRCSALHLESKGRWSWRYRVLMEEGAGDTWWDCKQTNP